MKSEVGSRVGTGYMEGHAHPRPTLLLPLQHVALNGRAEQSCVLAPKAEDAADAREEHTQEVPQAARRAADHFPCQVGPRIARLAGRRRRP